MRILMITADYLPNIGGLAAHVYHLSRAIQALGHAAVVVNPVESNRSTFERVEIGGVRTYVAKYPRQSKPYLTSASRTKATLDAVKATLAEFGRPDILHQHDFLLTTYACWLLSLRGPWVWTNHTSMFHQTYRGKRNRLGLRLKYGRVSGIFAVSPELADMSKALFRGRVPVTFIPNGVDVRMFRPSVKVDRSKFGLRENDFVVLCPRRMVEKNGVVFLALAAKSILKGLPREAVRFVFLGNQSPTGEDSGYIKGIRTLLHDEAQSQEVLFLGNLPMDLMPEMNAIADVVVLPSLVEAVSLSALEALATAKPLIATDIPGLREVARHEETALTVAPADPHALAETIIRLYRDSSLRERLSGAGYELVTKAYQWESVAERTIAFYRAILNAADGS